MAGWVFPPRSLCWWQRRSEHGTASRSAEWSIVLFMDPCSIFE